MTKFCNDNRIAAWFATSAKENINIGKIAIDILSPWLRKLVSHCEEIK
jgi:hypothetical protein